MKLVWSFLIIAIAFSHAGAASAPEKMTPVKITDGIYTFENSLGSGNSTVVITDEGVLVLDFHIANADQTLAGIRKLTDKKVRYLISSHSAGDHSSGAWHFREDKPVYIATKNQVKDLFMQEAKEFEERKTITPSHHYSNLFMERKHANELTFSTGAAISHFRLCRARAERKNNVTGPVDAV